jgi:hypothetical protein
MQAKETSSLLGCAFYIQGNTILSLPNWAAQTRLPIVRRQLTTNSDAKNILTTMAASRTSCGRDLRLLTAIIDWLPRLYWGIAAF